MHVVSLHYFIGFILQMIRDSFTNHKLCRNKPDKSKASKIYLNNATRSLDFSRYQQICL